MPFTLTLIVSSYPASLILTLTVVTRHASLPLTLALTLTLTLTMFDPRIDAQNIVLTLTLTLGRFPGLWCLGAHSQCRPVLRC